MPHVGASNNNANSARIIKGGSSHEKMDISRSMIKLHPLDDDDGNDHVHPGWNISMKEHEVQKVL